MRRDLLGMIGCDQDVTIQSIVMQCYLFSLGGCRVLHSAAQSEKKNVTPTICRLDIFRGGSIHVFSEPLLKFSEGFP
jgi:hypothetical protein